MRALPFLLLLTAGCGPGLLGPDFNRRLTRFGGCADVVFFAVDPDDEVMVTFSAQGLVAAAREVGAETTTVIELPSEDVALSVEQGSRVSDATCDDVIESPGPRIQRAWTAGGGTATVRIRPGDGAPGDRGDLVLEDVVFTAGSGFEVTLGRLEWPDVAVGWYPG